MLLFSFIGSMEVGTVQLVRAVFGFLFFRRLQLAIIYRRALNSICDGRDVSLLHPNFQRCGGVFAFVVVDCCCFVSSHHHLLGLLFFSFHFSRGSVNDLLPQRPIINTSVMGLYEGRINGLR